MFSIKEMRVLENSRMTIRQSFKCLDKKTTLNYSLKAKLTLQLDIEISFIIIKIFQDISRMSPQSANAAAHSGFETQSR